MSITTFTVNIPSENLSASTKLKVVNKVTDIIMFVPGTTDPVNTTGLKHEANKGYWRDEKHLDNLWAKIKELKPQYHDLNIEDTFFSWSGDNNHEARVEGAIRLLDLFLRVYSGWTEKEVSLHLVGHSHGGNVINEFSNIITRDDVTYKGKPLKYPKKWKIKSLVYLSTPFFKEQHQLNTQYLHKECKIMNVYNEYDITQRFVADFTLKNLEVLLSNYNAEKVNEALEEIKSVDGSIYEQLGITYVINNDEEGPYMWQQTVILLSGVNKLIKEFIRIVGCFEETGLISSQKEELLEHLNRIDIWSNNRREVFENNLTDRDGGYGRAEFFEDLDLLEVLGIVNTLFAIESGVEDSYLLGLLNQIFQNDDSGILGQIDDTSWSPEAQLNGSYEVQHIPIVQFDDYDSRNRKSEFDNFIQGIEKAMIRNKSNVREVLMRLISQFIPQNILSGEGNYPDILDNLMYLYTDDDIDNALAEARDNLRVYGNLHDEYYANLITEDDANNIELEIKPGSIIYLAMVSHSLSHTRFWKDVENGLRDSFTSGKNPSYRNK